MTLKASRVLLESAARDRNNNLNLIRMIAATAVLVSHAWPLTRGLDTQEPVEAITGFTLGELAVFAFFSISGFLISSSYDRSQSPKKYIVARTLRLMPGLFVSLVLVAFIMGPLVTDQMVSAYFGNTELYSFLISNTLLVFPQFTLPGVFQGNPVPNVEGSIWTLAYEVACYIAVLILGVLGLFRRTFWLKISMFAYAVAWISLQFLELNLPPRVITLLDFSWPFALGMMAYIWRAQIRLSLPGIIILLLTAVALHGTPLRSFSTTICLGYIIFYLAYVPKGALDSYNRLGDYSYGMYIYAFPVQGLMIYLFGPMQPFDNIMLSLAPTVLLSVASWHWVEKPALKLAHRT